MASSLRLISRVKSAYASVNLRCRDPSRTYSWRPINTATGRPRLVSSTDFPDSTSRTRLGRLLRASAMDCCLAIADLAHVHEDVHSKRARRRTRLIAGGWTRTSTPLREGDFKSPA